MTRGSQNGQKSYFLKNERDSRKFEESACAAMGKRFKKVSFGKMKRKIGKSGWGEQCGFLLVTSINGRGVRAWLFVFAARLDLSAFGGLLRDPIGSTVYWEIDCAVMRLVY